MRDFLPLEGKKNWYKGNLHCHSTMSDGRFTPEQLAARYKENGYSFLAFSEHELYTDWENFNREDFIIIPAIERSADNQKMNFHIHGIQGSSEYRKNSKKEPLKHNMRLPYVAWEGKESVQQVIDELRDTGNLVMFNHPVWSKNELEDMLNVDGYFALEIFNYGCEEENKTGLSTIYWDSLLRRGKKVWGIATDDNHNRNYFDEAPNEWDSYGGWVCVKANELSRDAVSDALLHGSFYASSGPKIYNYGIRNGEAFVECSPVDRVYFISYDKRGYSRRNKAGGLITKATYPLSGSENYIRIECQDKNGKTAWTNPMFL